jgi:hypothetical protein
MAQRPAAQAHRATVSGLGRREYYFSGERFLPFAFGDADATEIAPEPGS